MDNDKTLIDKVVSIQEDISKQRDILNKKEFEFEYNNGEIRVKLNGLKEIIKIDFNDNLLKNKDVLLNSLKEAINDASNKIEIQINNVIKKIWEDANE